jgi:acetyl-CoA C-acetyltransferase
LTFAGGPGNNYAGHAIATLCHLLRSNPGSFGLASAVGWYLTKHALGVYCTRPPRRPFASLEPRVQLAPARRASSDYVGSATLEAWTVAYSRDGSPDAAVISALTPQGERALARTSDPDVLNALQSHDPIDAPVSIAADQHIAVGHPG